MSQSLRQWLDERFTDVPATLRSHMMSSISTLDQPLEQGVLALALATDTQLTCMRKLSCASRDDALDLLTADALVTLLLELVSHLQIEDLDAYACGLMHAASHDSDELPPVSPVPPIT